VQRLAVRIWFSIIISSLFKKLLSFWYVFFPRRPGFILPFLNLIELVRFFIRSLTLTLRLSINITTGHIFVSLLGRIILFLLKSSFLLAFLGILIVFLSCGIFLFESCISIIQALVFSLLLSSYFSEHSS
jgi:F-type H+-transporting ATPase subunit a